MSLRKELGDLRVRLIRVKSAVDWYSEIEYAEKVVGLEGGIEYIKLRLRYEVGARLEYREENDMNSEYERGYEESMRMAIESELNEAAMRIAILEADLDEARAKKWNAVRKLKLIEEYGTATATLLENGEALTLHDKLELIKEGFVG